MKISIVSHFSRKKTKNTRGGQKGVRKCGGGAPLPKEDFVMR
jgi:hypothetical protein